MEHEIKFVRHTADSTNPRCQANGNHGQCPFEVVPGTTNCPRHGGSIAARGNERNALGTYVFEKFQHLFEPHAKENQLRNLTGEIAIMRGLLERTIERCESEVELMSYAPSIVTMVDKITGTVKTLDVIQTKLGNYLTRPQAMEFVREIAAIISEHIDDPEVIATIADQMQSKLTDLIAQSKEKQSD